MKKRVYLYIFLSFCLLLQTQGQDTLRMMQYNLMYYTDNSGVSDCNSTTNNLDNKDGYLRTIFHHVMPDVFCVNEIGSNVTYAERLLNNVINVDGVSGYSHGPLTNYSGGYIANMIFYNTAKLTLYDNYYITTSYRDINGYKMYYNSDELAGGDTVFITFWIAHLKAGSSAANASARYVQTQRLMSRIASMGNPGNYVLSGDFNMYSAEEEGYQELVHYSNSLYCLYDPINREGNWNNNSQFADIHTQSTHTQSDGCFSTGGLDDRFDFILVSPYVYYGSENIQVLPETYYALGQDGLRFNGSIISPQNNSISTTLANALYNQSDHLPVITEFAINAHPLALSERQNAFQIKVVNPIREQVELWMHCLEADVYTFEILTIDGKRVVWQQQSLDEGAQHITIPSTLHKGFYLLRITNSKQQQQICKLVQ